MPEMEKGSRKGQRKLRYKMAIIVIRESVQFFLFLIFIYFL